MVLRADGRFRTTSAAEQRQETIIEVDRDNPPVRGVVTATDQAIDALPTVVPPDGDFQRVYEDDPSIGTVWNVGMHLRGVPFFSDGDPGSDGQLIIDPGTDLQALRSGLRLASPLGPWVQRAETGAIAHWHARGLLLQPGETRRLQLMATTWQVKEGGQPFTTSTARQTVDLRLRSSVLLVPVSVVVVGRAGGVGNRLGWRSHEGRPYPAEMLEPGGLLRFSRAWFDDDTIQQGIVRDAAPQRRTESRVIQYDFRPEFDGSEAQLFDPSGGRRADSLRTDMNMEIDEVWRQCGIQFRLVSYREYLADNDCTAMRQCRPGSDRGIVGWDFPCADSASLRLVDALPVHQGLRVVLTDMLARDSGGVMESCGANGSWQYGVVTPGISRTAIIAMGNVSYGSPLEDPMNMLGARRLTIAHELGHSLGLNHRNNGSGPRSPLMSPSAGDGRDVNLAECALARTTACGLLGMSSCPVYP
jgi:hypothetical protein